MEAGQEVPHRQREEREVLREDPPEVGRRQIRDEVALAVGDPDGRDPVRVHDGEDAVRWRVHPSAHDPVLLAREAHVLNREVVARVA